MYNVLETGYLPLVLFFDMKLNHLKVILKVLYLEHHDRSKLVEAVAGLSWQPSRQRSLPSSPSLSHYPLTNIHLLAHSPYFIF